MNTETKLHEIAYKMLENVDQKTLEEDWIYQQVENLQNNPDFKAQMEEFYNER